MSRSTPTIVLQGQLANVTGIAGGGQFAVALLANGTVSAWGSNSTSELGDGTTTNRIVPGPVSGLTAVKAVAAGQNTAFAITSSGTAEA